MRYVEVTHTYVIPVPAEDVSVVEPLAREGMSIMEGFMKARAANLRDLRSDWKLMPKGYRPQQPVQQDEDELTYEPAKKLEFTDTPRNRDRELSKLMIEADADQGISFAGDVMGQRGGPPPHPWDQGLRVLPVDHDMAVAETYALKQAGRLCGEVQAGTRVVCVGVKGHAPGFHLWVPMEGKHGPAAEDKSADRSQGGALELDPGDGESGSE